MGACLTPFNGDGSLNIDALEREIEFLAADAHAITVGAVEAAEYTMLSAGDRELLLRQAAQMIDGRVPMIVGASAASVRDVLGWAELAAGIGASYIQVLMPGRPWGGEPAPAEVIGYVNDIAERSPLPIVAYHNPACGADPSIDTWIEIAQIPAVQAIKESSRNIAKIGRMVEEIDRTGLASYFATMQPLLNCLLLGGSGATMPPPGTRLAAQVVAAVRDGDIERARAWQRLFSIFPSKWGGYGLPPVMKCALRHFGVDIGVPASPYQPVSAEHDRQIGAFLEAAGVLGETMPDIPDVDQARKVLI